MLASFFKFSTLLAAISSVAHATSDATVDYGSVCGLVTSDTNIVDFAFGQGSLTVADGDIVTGTVTLNEDYHDNPPRNVSISAPGVKCGRSNFGFDRNDPSTFQQQVTCRTDSGVVPPGKDGSMVDIAMIFNYNFDSMDAMMLNVLQKMCKKMLFKRHVGCSGRGGGTGDPHLTTFDSVYYNFQKPGVYRLFESRNMLVQIFQEKCVPVAYQGEAAPSCYRGASIAFAGSVAKFFIQNKKIQVGKGTSSLDWLSVEKLKGNTDGYRVFVKADQSTYVDVNLAKWNNDYEYLNIAVQVSPYFKDPGLNGLLGNWNGNRNDDLKDNDKLAALHGYPINDNLFTCTGMGCAKFLKPATIKDDLARALPNDLALLHQSYTVVDCNTVLLKSFTPVLVPYKKRRLRGQEDTDESAAGEVHARGDATNAPTTSPPTDTPTPAPTTSTPTPAPTTVAPTPAPTDGTSSTTQPPSGNDTTSTPTATPTPIPVVNVSARAHELCGQVLGQIPLCDKYVPDRSHFVDTLCFGDATLLNDLTVVDNTKLNYLRECRNELDGRIEANLSTVLEMATLRSDRAVLQFGDLTKCPGDCSGHGSCLASACQCDHGYTGIACDIEW